MFEAKKKTLFTANDSKSTSKSAFVQAGLKISAEILTGMVQKLIIQLGIHLLISLEVLLSTKKFVPSQKSLKIVRFYGL